MVAPIMQGVGFPWRTSSVVVSKPLAALRNPLRPAEIEGMNASVREPYRPASTPQLLPDSTWASLACKAPAVCSQLQRMFVSERKTVHLVVRVHSFGRTEAIRKSNQ